MLNETPLIDYHRELGGKLVDFGGWNMPLNYGSQIEEHNNVRKACGWFDVSHMTVVDVAGSQAKPYLRYLLANDVAKLAHEGKALYSAMLNEAGGVIDDLIVYRVGDGYRLVVNCATREKDLRWMQQQAQRFDVEICERSELAMIAVQGPEARAKVQALLQQPELESLEVFCARELPFLSQPCFVARTGYTGEDGYEIMLPGDLAETFARRLSEAGVAPCGLAARDTLRLEAGMNLYGHEMDEDISPLQANMGWTIAWAPEDRDFIGRSALQAEKSAGVENTLVGLVILGKGVLRADQPVVSAGSDKRGVITSGTFAPSVGKSIALARVPKSFSDACEVIIRNKKVAVKCVPPSFVRKGRVLVSQ